MHIDIIFAIIVAFAIYKGYTRGLIVAVFSFLAVIFGLAAALKLSAAAADYLQHHSGYPSRWWPMVAFVVVFIGVALLVRLGATFLEKVVEIGLMGWVNKLGGILLYTLLFTIVYSVLLWMANQMYWLSPEVKLQSVIYPHIEQLGPTVINTCGSWMPIFRDMFGTLQSFFEHVAKQIPA
ncbi:membrane protein required for colicin V production [Chitinophaga skermanii]|uniref:Membrane protein required for colicin V production n=1 Tax=Chitinophaga skermanii TaxID=331697 RepID=A0A327R1G1_9BACT|nr:CvpA family protein [Chitinophaga skermanii]RAJ10471.1 membrane protein required for colicin V production [Chitinophaga skermanii]